MLLPIDIFISQRRSMSIISMDQTIVWTNLRKNSPRDTVVVSLVHTCGPLHGSLEVPLANQIIFRALRVYQKKCKLYDLHK